MERRERSKDIKMELKWSKKINEKSRKGVIESANGVRTSGKEFKKDYE